MTHMMKELRNITTIHLKKLFNPKMKPPLANKNSQRLKACVRSYHFLNYPSSAASLSCNEYLYLSF